MSESLYCLLKMTLICSFVGTNWHGIAIYRKKCPCYNGHAQNCICTHIHSIFQTSAYAGVIFLQYSRHVSFGMAIPPTAGIQEPAVPRDLPVFLLYQLSQEVIHWKKKTVTPPGTSFPPEKNSAFPTRTSSWVWQLLPTSLFFSPARCLLRQICGPKRIQSWRTSMEKSLGFPPLPPSWQLPLPCSLWTSPNPARPWMNPAHGSNALLSHGWS